MTSPLQVYDWSSDAMTGVLDSVIPMTPDVTPQQTAVNVAAGPDGTVWVAPRGVYRLERWDARTGVRLQHINAASDWFTKGQDREQGIPREVPPRPSVAALAHDANNYLWVLLHDAASTWTPLEPARTVGTETYTSSAQLNHLYDSVLDVYEASSGIRVASHRFAGRILGFAGSGLVFMYKEDSDGYPYYEVLRVTLESQ
jgi:hypothetical protein